MFKNKIKRNGWKGNNIKGGVYLLVLVLRLFLLGAGSLFHSAESSSLS
jgi:hypothetical protein